MLDPGTGNPGARDAPSQIKWESKYSRLQTSRPAVCQIVRTVLRVQDLSTQMGPHARPGGSGYLNPET